MALEVAGANLFNATPTITTINVINSDALQVGI
jgi:hypothetical protein